MGASPGTRKSHIYSTEQRKNAASLVKSIHSVSLRKGMQSGTENRPLITSSHHSSSHCAEEITAAYGRLLPIHVSAAVLTETVS